MWVVWMPVRRLQASLSYWVHVLASRSSVDDRRVVDDWLEWLPRKSARRRRLLYIRAPRWAPFVAFRPCAKPGSARGSAIVSFRSSSSELAELSELAGRATVLPIGVFPLTTPRTVTME